jgi:hypothetical protein
VTWAVVPTTSFDNGTLTAAQLGLSVSLPDGSSYSDPLHIAIRLAAS